jgi:hypothetical protein
MNDYHKEQIDALTLVDRHLDTLPISERRKWMDTVSEYLDFRLEVDHYLRDHFSDICTQTCYLSRLSACCSREGIITFFGDVVVNRLVSTDNEIRKLLDVLHKPNEGYKCVYLSKAGCLWRVKPIVCQMYLCDRAKDHVFRKDSRLKIKWELYERKRKNFTWPDRPVLFDDLEARFLSAGFQSSLMYLHNSPGLLRVKQKAGLYPKRRLQP